MNVIRVDFRRKTVQLPATSSRPRLKAAVGELVESSMALCSATAAQSRTTRDLVTQSRALHADSDSVGDAIARLNQVVAEFIAEMRRLNS